MIRDVELRFAKEELVERHIKEFVAEELKQLLWRHGCSRDRGEKSEIPSEDEHAILDSYQNLPDPELTAI